MAITQNLYTGNGTTTNYSFTFPYLNTTDIKVSIDGVDTTEYTLANATTIQFNTAPTAGTAIRIYRVTGVDELSATFYPGSAIRAQDLNDNFNQTLYIAQENETYNLKADGTGQMSGNLDLNNNRIINVASPVSGLDAVNKDYVDAFYGDTTIPQITRWLKTATAGQQSFLGLDDNGDLMSYSPNHESVYLNGALQQRNIDYLAGDGFSIFFNQPLQEGDVVNMLSYNNVVVVEGGAGGELPFTSWLKTATAGQTVFNGLSDANVTLDHSIGNEIVVLNGSTLARNIDYTQQVVTGGTQITLTTPCDAGDQLQVLSSNYIATGLAGTLDAANFEFTQAGTGAQTRTVESKLQDVVSVKDFGAVGDGVTDDTAAIQAALNANIGRSVLLNDGIFLVDSANLTIPAGVTLYSNGLHFDSTNRSGWDTQKPTLVLNPTYSILMYNGAAISGVAIAQKATFEAIKLLPPGSALTITDVAGYSGIAIKQMSAAVYVGHCAIYGFTQAFTTDTANTPRSRFEYLNIDCINGIKIDNDLGGTVLYCVHCHPYLTNSDADNIRSGIGFLFQNLSDWSWVQDCFAFNNEGFKVIGCNSIKFVNCGADHPKTIIAGIGFNITGASTETLLLGCQAASHNYGITVNTDSDDYTLISNTSVWQSNFGLNVDQGDVNVVGCSFRTLATKGVLVTDNTATVVITSSRFDNMPTAIDASQYYSAHVSNCVFENISGTVFANEFLTTLASAGTVTMPANTLFVDVTGTTTIGTIVGAQCVPGDLVTLTFTDGLTVNNGSIQLAGSANQVFTAGSTLTLRYKTGNTWLEVGRAIR
jgi:hypothetical protein